MNIRDIQKICDQYLGLKSTLDIKSHPNRLIYRCNKMQLIGINVYNNKGELKIGSPYLCLTGDIIKERVERAKAEHERSKHFQEI